MQPMNQEQLMKYIMELGFFLDDAVLYLDMHPDCREALKNYHEVKALYEEAVSIYEASYAPLRNRGVESDCEWTWINAPWPWEGVC